MRGDASAERSPDFMENLHPHRGVRVAIDDLWRGYDIVTQLQGLPVDLIKLDAWITGAGVDAPRTEAMCHEVLDVCWRIGLTVIAQGIVTKEQAEALLGMEEKLVDAIEERAEERTSGMSGSSK